MQMTFWESARVEVHFDGAVLRGQAHVASVPAKLVRAVLGFCAHDPARAVDPDRSVLPPQREPSLHVIELQAAVGGNQVEIRASGNREHDRRRLPIVVWPLDGEMAPQWSGKGLEASPQNGPIALTAPNDMKSGVQVTGSNASSATWNGRALPMRPQVRGSRRYHFGSDNVVVRLSTENGPLEIKGPRRASRGVEI